MEVYSPRRAEPETSPSNSVPLRGTRSNGNDVILTYSQSPVPLSILRKVGLIIKQMEKEVNRITVTDSKLRAVLFSSWKDLPEFVMDVNKSI